MDQRSITISTPARLHLGLLSFGNPLERAYGGVGIMVNQPRMVVRVRTDEEFVVRYGPYARRAAEFARHWSTVRIGKATPLCRIDVLDSYSEHVGLGSGTQLGLAIARGLDHIYGLPHAEPRALAASVNRGARSAVGTYGFVQGGLIAESGRSEGEGLAPLSERIALPESWRFLLIRPDLPAGASGERERSIFQRIQPVPSETTQRLREYLNEDILPAARAEDIATFSESVYRFGTTAGACFAEWQAGPFASELSAQIVAFVRGLGISGVGQSSWGPTLFAIVNDAEQSEWLEKRIANHFAEYHLKFDSAGPDNKGAEVST